MKTYVPYLRVSTKKQEKSGLGLEAQRAIIQHYAGIENAQLAKEFIETESGKDIENRKTLKEALAYCKVNQYTLVVAKLDRLSRDVEHIFSIIKQLGEGNFKSCDLPSTDSLTLSIFAGLAQREREIISIRTKLALKAKKERGDQLGTVENLTDAGRQAGVARNKAKARTNPNNIRAKSMIARCKESGMTLQGIADELNSNGFTTSRGRGFTREAVRRLI
jgi:DNA invertase Pin-like site-specific DNA recombinase